jgi:hypothetical protein
MSLWGRSVDEDTYGEIFGRGRSEGFDQGVLEGLRRGGADEVLERITNWGADVRDSDIVNLQSLCEHLREEAPGSEEMVEFLEHIADTYEKDMQ